MILNRYGRTGASSRLRTIQYASSLDEKGVAASFMPFFDDASLARLYEGRSTTSEVVSAYRRRVGQLQKGSRCDVLWVEKEALPWVPWLLESALTPRTIPLVVDFDDAVFHRYDMHKSALVRRILGSKLDRLMASASLVTAGNRYLADRAYKAGAQQVEIVPTVVDVSVYGQKQESHPLRSTSIGWIGTPSTWTEYMAPKMGLMSNIAEANGARIRAVGAGKAATTHPLLDILPWSEACEVSQIQQMDIGVMPLTDTPWARGKCGYKLIQYMACGLPVVASPVGVNEEIVEHGVNGFLASTEAEWRDALVTLIENPKLRQSMGAKGRKKVEDHYSLQVWGPRVATMIKWVAKRAMA